MSRVLRIWTIEKSCFQIGAVADSRELIELFRFGKISSSRFTFYYIVYSFCLEFALFCTQVYANTLSWKFRSVESERAPASWARKTRTYGKKQSCSRFFFWVAVEWRRICFQQNGQQWSWCSSSRGESTTSYTSGPSSTSGATNRSRRYSDYSCEPPWNNPTASPEQ